MEDFTLPSVGARFKKPEKKLSKGFSQTSLFLLRTIKLRVPKKVVRPRISANVSMSNKSIV
jgi:hypothetical protein